MIEPAARNAIYLQLGEELCREAERIADEASVVLKTTDYRLKTRDQVLVGLGVKILGSLQSLIADVRDCRLEAMHHLKTMCEAFIYLHVIAHDDTENTAKAVLAEAYRKKAAFYRANPEPARPKEHLEVYDELVAVLRKDNPVELRPLEQIAKRQGPELGAWYSRVYRMACEPAHIADLPEFLPRDGEIVIAQSTSRFHADVAMHYGLQMALQTVRALNENELGIRIPLEHFDQRLKEIETPTSTEEPGP